MGWSYQQKPSSGWLIDPDHPLSDFVGFWPMWEDGGITVADLSGNGRAGTFASNAPTWESGPDGSVLRFTSGSSQYIDLGTKQIILSEFTLYFKVKFADTSAMYSLFGSYNSANFRPCFWLRHNFAGATTNLYYGDLATGFSSGSVSNSLVANKWYDYVVTKKANVMSVYINDIFIGSDTDTDYTAETKLGDNVLIGAVNGSGTPAGFLNGWIDYFYLYNRALYASEVALLRREPFCMFKDPAELIMSAAGQAAVAGMAGAMTTNTGYWGW